MQQKTTKMLGGKSGKGFMPGKSGNPLGYAIVSKEKRELQKIERKKRKEIAKTVIEYLESQGYGAAERIVKISKSGLNKTALSANQDVLNRIGVGVQKNNIGVAVQLNIDKTREEYA